MHRRCTLKNNDRMTLTLHQCHEGLYNIIFTEILGGGEHIHHSNIFIKLYKTGYPRTIIISLEIISQVTYNYITPHALYIF